MEQFHSLLLRQLKRHFQKAEAVPSQLQGFVASVNDAYFQFDTDRLMLERALDLSSQELLQANSEMRAVVQALPDAIFVLSNTGKVLNLKTGQAEASQPPVVLSSARNLEIPVSLNQLDDIFQRESFQASIREALQQGSLVMLEYPVLTKEGEQFYQARILPLPAADGLVPDSVAVTLIDITEHRRAQKAARASEEQYRRIVEAARQGVWTTDNRGTTTFVNGIMAEMLGYDIAEIMDAGWFRFMDLESRGLVRRRLMSRPFKSLERQDIKFLRRDGSALWTIVSMTPLLNEEGEQIGAQSLVTDITDRKVLEQQLHHQAMYDGLTDLPNRAFFLERLREEILVATQQDQTLALLLLDFDRFKDVNDTFGHYAGDILLRQVGPHLKNVLREAEVLARLGGDEFAVLLPSANYEDAVRVALAVRAALEVPFVVEGQHLELGASTGIVLFPEHGSDAETLLRCADIAMYEAKRTSRDYVVYLPEFDQHSPSRLTLLGDLRQGIDQGQLVLYYQPQLNLRTGEVVRVEALLRWQHPRLGLLLPDEFLPLAETTGVIHSVTDWVLRTAIHQIMLWADAGHPTEVAINLSVRNLQPQLPQQFARELDRYGVPPHLLHAEITESSLMADPELAFETITRLQSLGVRVAIDDFGTGYSSLAYLHRLPVDEIKIDKSFVTGMSADAHNTVIVRSTIELGHNLGLGVVAEGVEDSGTFEALVRLGCDTAQGYYLGPPIAAAETQNGRVFGERRVNANMRLTGL